jgi:hypothetical protein
METAPYRVEGNDRTGWMVIGPNGQLGRFFLLQIHALNARDIANAAYSEALNAAIKHIS